MLRICHTQPRSAPAKVYSKAKRGESILAFGIMNYPRAVHRRLNSGCTVSTVFGLGRSNRIQKRSRQAQGTLRRKSHSAPRFIPMPLYFFFRWFYYSLSTLTFSQAGVFVKLVIFARETHITSAIRVIAV